MLFVGLRSSPHKNRFIGILFFYIAAPAQPICASCSGACSIRAVIWCSLAVSFCFTRLQCKGFASSAIAPPLHLQHPRLPSVTLPQSRVTSFHTATSALTSFALSCLFIGSVPFITFRPSPIPSPHSFHSFHTSVFFLGRRSLPWGGAPLGVPRLQSI